MKARVLIGSASYDPDTLKVLYKAFDDAWEQIAPEVSDRSEAVWAARMTLSETVLGLARNGIRNGQTLTDAAVQAMFSGATKLRRDLPAEIEIGFPRIDTRAGKAQGILR